MRLKKILNVEYTEDGAEEYTDNDAEEYTEDAAAEDAENEMKVSASCWFAFIHEKSTPNLYFQI